MYFRTPLNSALRGRCTGHGWPADLYLQVRSTVANDDNETRQKRNCKNSLTVSMSSP